MWLLGKIKDSMESIPLQRSWFVRKSEEDDSFFSTEVPSNLHSNILTPDKIPEFFLPPRLCKTNPLLETETSPSYLHCQNQTHMSHTVSDLMHIQIKKAYPVVNKTLPFCAEGYGLSGIYESPNTRRKESLFHSEHSVYMLDKSIRGTRLENNAKLHKSKSATSEFLPLFYSKSLSESGITGSETSSSSVSWPLSFCDSAKSCRSFSSGHLKAATSCPWLCNIKEEGVKMEASAFAMSPSRSSCVDQRSHTLTPHVFLPLKTLQCQERLQLEHVLPLEGCGQLRLSAEHNTSSSTVSPCLSTIRVRVVSVESLRNDGDLRTLNCALILCLIPGKLQRQESATIRNCRSPVFNQDFFFTELSQQDLLELQLKIKVVNKPAAGTLRRAAVMGVITKPLFHLLRLTNG